MKKRWVILIACLCVITGFLAGGYAGIRFWQRFDELTLETRFMADAKTRLAVLESLKKADQNKAVQLLEVLLDGDVIGINAIMDTSDRKKELVDTLSQIAKYRAKTKYRSTEPEVATAVQRALERASQANLFSVKRDVPQATD